MNICRLAIRCKFSPYYAWTFIHFPKRIKIWMSKHKKIVGPTACLGLFWLIIDLFIGWINRKGQVLSLPVFLFFYIVKSVGSTACLVLFLHKIFSLFSYSQKFPLNSPKIPFIFRNSSQTSFLFLKKLFVSLKKISIHYNSFICMLFAWNTLLQSILQKM